LPKALEHLLALRRACGTVAAINIMTRRSLNMSAPVTAQFTGANGRKMAGIEIRPMDSDLFVAGQIFGRHHYELSARVVAALAQRARDWRRAGHTPVIVDGGANTGYASLYFADIYPDAIVLAVEPNPATFEILVRHTAANPRIKPKFGALWGDQGGVDIEFPAGGAWAARTVAPEAEGQSSIGQKAARIPSLTLEDLIAETPNGRPLIIKLDIEGAERQVCAASAQTLRDAACIIVEPHDWLNNGAGCLTPLFKALAGKEMDTFIQGENLVLVCSPLLEATD
jgi:FkbM family methyltransferase